MTVILDVLSSLQLLLLTHASNCKPSPGEKGNLAQYPSTDIVMFINPGFWFRPILPGSMSIRPACVLCHGLDAISGACSIYLKYCLLVEFSASILGHLQEVGAGLFFFLTLDGMDWEQNF